MIYLILFFGENRGGENPLQEMLEKWGLNKIRKMKSYAFKIFFNDRNNNTKL